MILFPGFFANGRSTLRTRDNVQNFLHKEVFCQIDCGKWTLRIMIAVLSGHNRFNELQPTIKGISARVLSGELKDLEINGL